MVSRLKRKVQEMTKQVEGLMNIVDLLERITMIKKDNGQESGLTGADRNEVRAITQSLAQALDEGVANAKRAAEAEDQIAKLQSEIDQLKAEVGANPAA